jgi:predicted ATPase
VTEAVLGLATKSLVSVDARVGPVKYRLLDTTRAFAARKLREAEGDVLDAVLRRHALEMQKKLTVADADYDGMSRAPWRAAHGGQIEDIRAALDWCFSESGDLQVGIQVMVNALPLHELGLLAEQTERIERALAYLHELTPPRPDLELRLILKLSWPSLEPGWSGRPTLSILSRTMELAERVADTSSRIGALHCAWLAAFVAGDYPSATKASEGALKVARDSRDQAGVVLSERLLAQCRHFMGDHEAARQLAERTLARESYRLPAECASVIPRRVSMRIILARILWIEGRPDSAARMAEECLAMAEHAHNHAQLQTLGFASIPIAIWRGDTELAEDMVDRMRVLAQKGDSPFWGSWARSFESVLEVMQTTSDAGSPPPRMPTVPTINAMELDCIASVAPYRHHPVTLHRLSSGACGWCSAELLRKQGEHLSSQGEAEAAERQFTSSMAVAARQNALAWELRAALSLAQARIGQGRRAQAHALVAPLYARFQEGLDTSDLRAAQSVLSS